MLQYQKQKGKGFVIISHTDDDAKNDSTRKFVDATTGTTGIFKFSKVGSSTQNPISGMDTAVVDSQSQLRSLHDSPERTTLLNQRYIKVFSCIGVDTAKVRASHGNSILLVKLITVNH